MAVLDAGVGSRKAAFREEVCGVLLCYSQTHLIALVSCSFVMATSVLSAVTWITVTLLLGPRID